MSASNLTAVRPILNPPKAENLKRSAHARLNPELPLEKQIRKPATYTPISSFAWRFCLPAA